MSERTLLSLLSLTVALAGAGLVALVIYKLLTPLPWPL